MLNDGIGCIIANRYCYGNGHAAFTSRSIRCTHERIGNLLKESGVTERLAKTARNALICLGIVVIAGILIYGAFAQLTGAVDFRDLFRRRRRQCGPGQRQGDLRFHAPSGSPPWRR